MWSRSVIPSKVMTDSSEQQVAAESGTAEDINATISSSTSITVERSRSGTGTTVAAVPANVHTCGNLDPSFRRSSTSGVQSVESDTDKTRGERGASASSSINYSGESLPGNYNVAGDPAPPEVITSTPVPSDSSTNQSGSDRQTDPPQPSLPPTVSSTTTAAPTQTNTTSSTATNIDMSGNPDYHHHSASSRSSGPTNNSSSSSSSSRRQRNGLFGINLDLNFDPSSWLVPSNVAGRSISSLSVLPDWVRHPASIIPNRGTDNSSQSSSGLSEGPRQSQQHHRHHEHYTSSGGTASRLVSHHSAAPFQSGAGGADWNPSSSFQTSSSIPSNMHHHHHHHLPHGAPVRTRHTVVTSMRSVDEDLDADYNPVSTIDIGATGRENHGDAHSYVIDMDSPMGGWAEDDGPSSSSHGGLRGASSSHANNSTSSEAGNAVSTSGADGSGTNSTRVTVDIPLAGRPLLGAQGIPGGVGGAAGQGGGGGQDGSSPSMSDATAGANERTRAAEILRDAPETRAFINEISRYTTIRPFIVINFLKGVFDHGTSILAFLALIVTFSHANSMVKKEVSKQRKRNLLYLTMIVINLMACVAFIYYIFNDMELYYALVFMPTPADLTAFWSLMWAVGVTDYVAKFGTVLVKIVVVSLPGCILPFQKRGKFYLFIEYSSQLYRSFLPVYPWLSYLVSAYEGTASMFGLLLAGLYIIFKITDSVKRFKDWLKALEKLLSNVHYGTNPTTKQLDGAGTICPICHDNFANPTRLQCSHIFCEECVATWFDRERTCPMCRAKVVDDPTYRDGSTSQYIQLF